jgi:hypothetical protein
MLLLNTDDMVQEYKFGLEKLKEEQQWNRKQNSSMMQEEDETTSLTQSNSLAYS